MIIYVWHSCRLWRAKWDDNLWPRSRKVPIQQSQSLWIYKFPPKENRKLQAEKHNKIHVVEFPKLLAIGLLSRRHSPQNYRQWGQVAANPSRDLQKAALPLAIVGLPLAIWRRPSTILTNPTAVAVLWEVQLCRITVWESVDSRSAKKFTTG